MIIGIVGNKNVRLSDEDLTDYGMDRTTIWTADPSVIVLPGCVAEVQKVVIFANEYKLAIVPSGGRTGLSGGAVAKDGEIVVASAIREQRPADLGREARRPPS